MPHFRGMMSGSGVAAALILSGCGGGGVSSTPTPPVGSAPAPTPTPVPTPTPTPTPPPTGLNFNTAEARRTDSFAFHGAIAAYDRNATGQGILVGVIDSGIDIDSPEFSGRIHARSFDTTGSGRTVDGDGSHGTQVAQVLVGARNDVGTFGIAFDSTLLVLRADRPGSCTSSTSDPETSGCRYPESAIAAGLDRAVESGARVVNISLGGETPPGTALQQAVARATAAGVILVLSAGNSGNKAGSGVDPANPEPFAKGIRDAGGDLVIIVGSVDENRAMSGFSNRAGTYSESFLTALGEAVCCVYENGVLRTETRPDGNFIFLLNGTSFAAPQVAGAIALVAQAFPSLTPRQIVALLYQSARDAGGSGTDAIFGRGVLDIGRAFAPVGTSSLAGTGSIVLLGAQLGQLSGPMGDARGSAQSVITDSFGRAFLIDLAPGLTAPRIGPRLLSALDQTILGRVAARGPTALSLSFAPASGQWSSDPFAPISFSNGPVRALAASMVTRLGKYDRLGIAVGRGVGGLLAGERGDGDAGFLIAASAGHASASLLAPSHAGLWRRNAGSAGNFSLTAEAGWVGGKRLETVSHLRLQDINDSRYNRIGFGWDRRFGPASLALTAIRMQESGSLLGARFTRLFGARGASSYELQATAHVALPKGWSIGGEWAGLKTRPDRAGLFDGGHITAQAWSIDLTRSGLAVPGDRLSLRMAQPLRVTGGALRLGLPVAHDAMTGTTEFGTRRLSLKPTGQERVVEAGYRMLMGSAVLDLNGWWRREPGHFSALDDDFGGAVRFTLGY